MTEVILTPCYREHPCGDDYGRYWPAGWRIARQEIFDDEEGMDEIQVGLFDLVDDNSPMVFASKRDCERAIQALNESGVTATIDTWLAADISEMRRLCVESLPW